VMFANMMQFFHSCFDGSFRFVPRSVATAGLLMEVGSLPSSWRLPSLLLRFFAKVAQSLPTRYSYIALQYLLNSLTASLWERSLRSTLKSFLPATFVLPRRCVLNATQLYNLCKGHLLKDSKCMEIKMWASVRNKPSLWRYSCLRSHSNIDKAHAYSLSQRGLCSHAYFEEYLDSWSADSTGVRLKLLARLGALPFRPSTSRRAGLLFNHDDTCCTLCGVCVESIEHFALECSVITALCSSLRSAVHLALSEVQGHCSLFPLMRMKLLPRLTS